MMNEENGGDLVGHPDLDEAFIHEQLKGQQGDRDDRIDRRHGNGPPGVATTEMGEGDESVGAGHKEHAQPNRRIGREEAEEAPNHERNGKSCQFRMAPMRWRSQNASGKCISGTCGKVA